MKTKVEALEGNKVKLTVTVDAKEINERIKKTYKDFAHKYTFPGFRKGKAPRPIIDNALGAEAVLATVTDEAINDAYPKAIEEADIFPVARPEFEDQDVLAKDGKDLVFAATVEVKPEFELSNYDPIKIDMPPREATEDEINGQIDALRDYYFTLEDSAASAKITDTSYVDLKIKASNDKGEDMPALSSDSRTMELGQGVFPPVFDNELVGMKKGQKKSFDVPVDNEDAKMMTLTPSKTDSIHFDVEILAIKKKVLPELNDEWAAEMGFENVDVLKDGIKDTISQQKAEHYDRLIEDKTLFELGQRIDADMPEALVQDAEQRLMSNFFQQLQQNSLTLDAYLTQQGLTNEQFKEDIKMQATEITRQDLALDAWARHAKMKVTDKDITQEFKDSGAEDPAKLEAQWRENGQMYLIKEGILRTRATKDLIDTAEVTVLTEQDEKPAKKASSTKKSTTAKKDTAAKKETPAKKATKSTAKAADKSDKKPAAKKAAPKKTATKKAADK